MIKDLIKQIAYEEITLSKALTIAKIIAKKVGNQDFENWIQYEINGYNSNELVPEYRKSNCIVKGEIMDQFGVTREIIPISFEGLGKETLQIMNVIYFQQSISTLESNYEQLTSETGQFLFLPEQVQLIEKSFKLREQYGRMLKSAWKEVPKLQLKMIIERTKQNLLDTLLELDKQFPNLESEYQESQENKKIVNSIITNNIYGNNNPVNVASGENVNQSDFNMSINVNYSQLEQFGVESKDIEEIKTIILENGQDKDSLKNKAMKWLGKVSASVAGKGLYDKIPELTEWVNNLIQ